MQSLKNAVLITALKTPYLPTGQIDLLKYDQLIDHQLLHGVDGIVVGGTTGEGHLMESSQLISLIQHVVTEYGNKLLVIGNTGSNFTHHAQQRTREGFAAGMHASLQINPYYGKTSHAGLHAHFNQVLALGPAWIYNVPGRTGQDILPDVVEKLALHPYFVGVKECVGNERIQFYEKRGIACWSGNDEQAFDARHQARSHGVISVAANLVPGLIKSLMHSPDERLQKTLMPLFQWLFLEPNPIPLNTALAMLHAAEPVFRLPYLPLSQEQQKQAIEIIQRFDRSALPGIGLNVLADSEFCIL